MTRIKLLREEFGISQQQLATLLDTTQQTIARWETGQTEPPLETLVKLADHWGVTVDELVRDRRSRPWLRDELILALDLYMATPASSHGKNSPEVAALSETLNQLAAALGFDRSARFRNLNGVSLKLMNFRRFDPTYIAAGKRGMTNGNKDEAVVWDLFATDRERLIAAADAIKAGLALLGEIPAGQDDGEDIAEAEEGRVLTRLHRSRERSRALVEQRKQQALAQQGRLRCEACGFDFERQYGERGRGWIEAHHTQPVCTLAEGHRTKIEDLALICANCHRMIHAATPWLSMDQLRSLLNVERQIAA